MVKKNIKNILLPYLLFAVSSYLIWFYFFASYTPSLPEIREHLQGILYGNNGDNIMFYNGVLWYLPCLFATKVLFSSFTELSVKKRFLLLFLFFFSIAGYLFSVFFPEDTLVFGLESALTAVVFFGSGFIWNTQAEKLNTFFHKHASILFPIFTLSCMFFATLHFIMTGYQVDLRLNNLGNYYLFYLASGSGILSTIALSMAINKNRILEYIGKKSLVLFVWHLLFFSFLNIYIIPQISQNFIKSLPGPTLPILTTLISIGTILFLDFLYRKMKLTIEQRYGTK